MEDLHELIELHTHVFLKIHNLKKFDWTEQGKWRS